jgi:hypothetical protein
MTSPPIEDVILTPRVSAAATITAQIETPVATLDVVAGLDISSRVIAAGPVLTVETFEGF